MLLWRALTGDAKLLISHFRDEDLLWDAGQRIFDVLAQAHKHISEFEDQDNFDNAFYKLHRERNQTLLQFANVARAAYLKHDAYGYPLPDRTKGMIFLRQAMIPGHLEDHVMAKTNGSRNFSDSSMPSRFWPGDPRVRFPRRSRLTTMSGTPAPMAPSTTTMTTTTLLTTMGATMRTTSFEDHDGEWIDMSGISEDAKFEELEFACILENLLKGRKRSSKDFWRSKKAGAKVSPVMF